MKYVLLTARRFAELLKAEASMEFLRHQDCGIAQAKWAQINAALAAGELTGDCFVEIYDGLFKNTDKIDSMARLLNEELNSVGIQEFKKVYADYLSRHSEVDCVEIEHADRGWREPEEWDRYDSITVNGYKIHRWEISTLYPDLKEEYDALCRFPSEILIEEYGMGTITISRDGISFCASH